MPAPIALEFGRNLARQSGAPASGDEIRIHDVSEDDVVVKTWSDAVSAIHSRTGQEYQITGTPKVGGTAGWVVAGATNLAEATLPASQTGAKLICPIRGLKVGWIITALKLEMQIESAGGTVTVDCDIRTLTNVAADPTDASVATFTQLSVTADTKVEMTKTGLSLTIAADVWPYLVITATTAASTDIRLLGGTVTVTEN